MELQYVSYHIILVHENAKICQTPFLPSAETRRENTWNLHICTGKCSQIFSSSPVTRILVITYPLHGKDQHPQKDKHIYVHVHVKYCMCEVLHTTQSVCICVCILVHQLHRKK